MPRTVWTAPPNWPQPPEGWTPSPGWQPDPAWGPAPAGWNFYSGGSTSSHGTLTRTVKIAAGTLLGLVVLVGCLDAAVDLPSEAPIAPAAADPAPGSNSGPRAELAPTAEAAAPEPAAPEPEARPRGYVSRGELGEAWPLTTTKGVLACDGSDGFGAATIATGGKVYALNGIAKGWDAGLDIDPIWADNPAIAGTKKDIGVLIDRALRLCE